jgi:hypothetical protein
VVCRRSARWVTENVQVATYSGGTQRPPLFVGNCNRMTGVDRKQCIVLLA